MIFLQTELMGACIVELEKLEDERGYFARSWCQREFEAQGLDTRLVQCNISMNRKSGTLRGMHFQVPPFAEAKLVRCTRGALFDVIIDLRPDSPSFLKWIGVELTVDNGKMMYIPKGFAHGFLTLEDDTEIFYQMSEFYAPECARGVRWDDPLFGIRWPRNVTVISDRDATYPDSAESHFAPFRNMVKHG